MATKVLANNGWNTGLFPQAQSITWIKIDSRLLAPIQERIAHKMQKDMLAKIIIQYHFVTDLCVSARGVNSLGPIDAYMRQ